MIRDLIKPKPQESSPGLLAQSPAEVEEMERTGGFYAAIALEVLAVALALWTGLSYKAFLEGNGSLTSVIVLAVMLETLLLPGMYLTKSPLRRILLLLGVAIGTFAFLITRSTLPYAAGAAAVLFLFLLWGESLGRARAANSLKLRFLHGVHPLLVKFTTAVILGGLLIFLPYWTPAKAFPSQRSFEGYYQNIGGALHKFYGEIQFTGSFDEFVTSLARYRLADTAEFRRLPPSRQTEALQELKGTLKENLGKAFNVAPAEEGSPMGAIVYKNAVRILGDMQTRFGPWFLAGWYIIVFAVLRGIGTLVYWVAALVALVIFHTLRAMGIVRMRGETQTQEVVEYI